MTNKTTHNVRMAASSRTAQAGLRRRVGSGPARRRRRAGLKVCAARGTLPRSRPHCAPSALEGR